MKLLLNWRQVLPTIVTLAAMICGFFSILVTLEGMDKPNPGQYHLWAAQLIMLALILDGLDGNLARILGGCSQMGAELDTYVDMTAFGIAPAVLIYVVTLQGSLLWRVVMTSAVVLSGMVRLARFKVTDPYRGQMGYNGLPITACAAWVALFVFISQSEPPVFAHRGRSGEEVSWLTEGPVAAIFLIGILAFIFLQVSNVRYPKPSKKAALFIPSALLVLLLFLPGVKIGSYTSDVYAAAVMILLGIAYIVLGPVYMKRMTLRQNNHSGPAKAVG
jgi:CDP-diacylglycerol--serine O-phosphatidyltransferase